MIKRRDCVTLYFEASVSDVWRPDKQLLPLHFCADTNTYAMQRQPCVVQQSKPIYCN